MHIINIKIKPRFPAYLFVVGAFFLLGCQNKPGQEPEYLAQRAQHYYQQAVKSYQERLKQGKDLERLNFELGLLFYRHGDFEQALGYLRSSALPEARRLEGVALFKLNEFTDAWEIFRKDDKGDDEALYYKGLTAEKLNLFDQALMAYRQVKSGDFRKKADLRAKIIAKETSKLKIKDVDPLAHKLILASPAAEKYPQAGALFLLCDENIKVDAGFSELSELRYLVRILNERGKDEFSEAQIEYDSTFEKVELIYARTIKPDGTVVDVGSQHIRDVSKYLNFPLYSNARVFIISFPEISAGSVIDYKLKVHRNQMINKKDIVVVYSLQSSEPILKANFSLTYPKEKQLHLKLLNTEFNNFAAKLEASKEENSSFITYSWGFTDIPQIIPESNMPAYAEVNPIILISSFKDWQEIHDWWWPLIRDKIRADSAIKEKVLELTRNKNSPEERARAIYNFCAKDIRYVAVEYGDAGYEPHAAADIFRNKYGDCKDQAILLVTMLKEAGIQAYPVLIPTKGTVNVNEDFPAVLFNHCIAAIELNAKTIFMDPTAQTCSFSDLPVGDQGRRVLIFGGNFLSIEETPLFAPEHNLILQKSKVKVNQDEGIVVNKTVSTFGFFDQGQRYWLLYTQPEVIEEDLGEKIQDVSIGAKLTGYKIENVDDLDKPVVLSYSFSGPEFFTNAGKLRILPELASLDVSVVARDKRKYAIDLETLDSKVSELEIQLPPGLAVKYLPQDFKKQSPWLDFEVGYGQSNGKITFRQSAYWKKTRVGEKEYREFKEFFTGLATAIKERIVLEKIR